MLMPCGDPQHPGIAPGIPAVLAADPGVVIGDHEAARRPLPGPSPNPVGDDEGRDGADGDQEQEPEDRQPHAE
jgi:hypothetical protein